MSTMKDVDQEFQKVMDFMDKEFGEGGDLQTVLFMIGIQELGKGYKKLNKNQKLDVLHIAVCTLLEQYGYYEFEGLDEEGWPHFKATDKLPFLKPGHQSTLMKQAAIDYFKNKGLIS
jgi:hypothetical protein